MPRCPNVPGAVLAYHLEYNYFDYCEYQALHKVWQSQYPKSDIAVYIVRQDRVCASLPALKIATALLRDQALIQHGCSQYLPGTIHNQPVGTFRI